MSEDEWGTVDSGNGEFAKPDAVNGHLLIVYPIGYIPHIQTAHSRPDKLSDAIRVDVIDLDDVDESGAPGKVYRGTNWMQSVLISKLRPEIGRKVLAVMGKGVGKKGFHPPWVLTDMAQDQAARERATAWLAAHPSFTPSVFREAGPGQVLGSQTQPPQGYSPTPDSGYGNNGFASTPAPAAPAQAPAAQQQQYLPVPGSPHQVSQEEMTLLQQIREQRRQREALEDPTAPPPF